MFRRRALFALLALALGATASARGPDRLQYGTTTFRLTWDGEDFNEYQPEAEGVQSRWRRMIRAQRLADVHDMASLRNALEARQRATGNGRPIAPVTCLPERGSRPAECREVLQLAVQDEPDGLIAVTEVSRYVLRQRVAIDVDVLWREYGIDSLARSRAFVNSPAGRDAIREALDWPVPFDAAPKPMTRRERAASNRALRKIFEDADRGAR